MILLCIWSLFVFSGCSGADTAQVDKLNEKAYASHYTCLDSTRIYAQAALERSEAYGDGRAEALNHLAFVSMARMDYAKVKELIGDMGKVTDNQIELLVADVQMMRLCQRQSHNKDFYVYRERALHRINRIEEEQQLLTPHQRKRMAYAFTEFHIVASTYFYYVGLTDESVAELEAIEHSGYLEQDAVQMMNYLYNVGSGGIIHTGTPAEICQAEFEYLMRCYLMAQQQESVFFVAQSLQGLSEHLQQSVFRDGLIADNLPAIKFVNTDNMPDSLIAGNLAERALELFSRYGDVYQTAGSYRTLAQCYWELQDYPSAIICLNKALTTDTIIQRAPDLVASIREQLSLAYSAIDDKPNSDYNRNIYLDMQEKTRQDRQLEARAEQLGESSELLNGMMLAVILMIVFVVVLLVVFDMMRRKAEKRHPTAGLFQPLEAWKESYAEHVQRQEEAHEEIEEQTKLAELHLLNNKKRNLEQRAKIALVNSITPFIDRIIHEVRQLRQEDDEKRKSERFTYIAELTDKINEYNNVLTNWIRIRQGQLDLRIESFPLQPLFDIVAKGKMSFALKGITLEVADTDVVVKADKTLTLFMINTLADNARKFTSDGGKVRVEALRTQEYVEISVADTGIGMDERQLTHLFDHKPISDEHGVLQEGKSHGFGLMNCKGIIDKYKKTSQLFACCGIGADSDGKGSRFWFRLPLGVVRLCIFISCLCGMEVHAHTAVSKSQQFADSAYFSNIAGTYAHTMEMADSCIYYLNQRYKHLCPQGRQFMSRYDAQGIEGAELCWFKDSLDIDYTTILDVRNEISVAALALHQWDVYSYNNKLYTQLFRERSADASLGDYVRVMQRSEVNKSIAIILLILLLVFLLPAYYLLYYRHRLMYGYCVERIRRINALLEGDATPEEKLERIGAIWSSHHLVPDRRVDTLRQLVAQIQEALRHSIDTEKRWQTQMELATDELRRRQYESDRLHVSNSVLDNCLSTLKHETMYYPSRIRQIVDSQPCDLEALGEVADYYHALYSILSEQAMRQIEMPLRPNPDMMDYLLQILRRGGGGMPLRLSEQQGAGGYRIVSVYLSGLSLTTDQCRNLFTPQTVDVQFLVCRQIVRELGECTHARGCGISAHVAEEGTVVEIVVPDSLEWNLQQA